MVELKSTTSGNMYRNLAKNNKLNYTSVSSEPIGINFNNQYGHIKVSIKDLEKNSMNNIKKNLQNIRVYN